MVAPWLAGQGLGWIALVLPIVGMVVLVGANVDNIVGTWQGRWGSSLASWAIWAALGWVGFAAQLQLGATVGAMLLAFIALIALLNGILSGVGGWFNHPELSLQMILGWIFSPLAWVIGVPWHEATVAGSFIGQKLIINEFVAYMNFGEYLKADAEVAAAGLQVISDHTKAIISFALCGFANLSSIAILIGGLGGMAPNRRQDIAQLGLRAVAAGTLSNLMSATIAGGFLAL